MKKPKNFEEGMAQLEKLLAQLSDSETPLDTAVKLYSQTADLVLFCNEALKGATLQMEEIDVKLEQLNLSSGE